MDNRDTLFSERVRQPKHIKHCPYCGVAFHITEEEKYCHMYVECSNCENRIEVDFGEVIPVEG